MSTEDMARDEADGADDENLWLEDIDGAKALNWVTDANRQTLDVLKADPRFDALEQRLLAIFQSRERIAVATVRGPWCYNFWQDGQHVRGIWRRTRLPSYATDHPDWDVLLDLDALAQTENENWVWAGATMLYPAYRRALLTFSRGGGDAAVVREFDVESRTFVAGGFALAEAKSQVAWVDDDEVFVSTDNGPASLTASGYPRIVKRWRRGQSLENATVVFEAEHADVLVNAACSRDWHEGRPIARKWIFRRITFQKTAYLVESDGAWVQMDVPADADVETFADRLLVLLKSDWQVGGARWPQGAVVSIGFDAFMAGDRAFHAIFIPAARRALKSLCKTHTTLFLSYADDLEDHCEKLTLSAGRWQVDAIPLDPAFSSDLHAVESDENDDVWIFQSGPLVPTRVALWHSAQEPSALDARVLKALPMLFDATGLVVRRFDARSTDGTRVPYLVIGKEGAGAGTPTLLYGYGGFEISMLPLSYNAAVGAAWLEGGGNYVVAGLRGGGEFGPAWHLAAVRENKQNCFDDLIAVAEDLATRDIATAARLAIQGGSNGGLLVGAVMVQRPELCSAVICQVPLLDMRRYHRLLAGASWVAEYGDPDVAEDWDFIGAYSPYQHLKPGVRYPRTLIATSTRDDRVHPGHARKMARRMQRLGAPALYFENTEGGHAGAANAKQQALLGALAYTFLWQTLG